MAGWFEAFSDFARGAAPALDRYQMLRQLDQQNQFKLRQQQFLEDREKERIGLAQQQQGMQQQLMDRQMQLLDQSILDKKQQDFTANRMPGSELTEDEYNLMSGELQMGGLGAKVPTYEPLGDEVNVQETPSQPGWFGGAVGGRPGGAVESRQVVEGAPSYQYLGTPQQQQAEQQRRILMSVIGGLDPYAKAQAVTGGTVTRPPVEPYRAPIAVTGDGVKPATLMDPRQAMEQGLQQYFQPRATTGSGGAGNQQIQQLDPETMAMIDRAAVALAQRQISPSQVAQLYGGMGGGAAQVKRMIADRAIKLDPTLNLQELEANYKFSSAPGTQTTVRFIENIEKTIPTLENIIGKMKLGNVKIINAATLATKGQFGSKDVASFYFAQTLLADEIAKILQGGGTGSATSDAKLKQALELLDSDMSPQQWEGVLDTAREMLAVRKKSLTKGTYMEGKSGEQPQEAEVEKIWKYNPQTKKWGFE